MDERNKDEKQGVKKKKYIIPEEIELEEGLQLRRVYDWLPYTYWRILRVMKELGWDMIQIWQGYKANRRPGYCEIYRIVEHETGRVIGDGVTIYQIQKAWKQHPANEKVWNPAAREFYMKYMKEDPTDGEPGAEETKPE